MIDQFVYDIPTRILYGAGSLKKLHEVRGGNNDADPVKLSDEDVLGMLERSYR